MHQLVVYVPKSHLGRVKEALFAAGAGQIGAYSHCCWQTLGTGQFKPLAGSRPHIGNIDHLSQVDEYKVEMVVDDHLVEQTIDALRASHPYETPAFHLIPIHCP